MKDDRDDARHRQLGFHWLVNTAFALVVTLPFEFDREVVPFAAGAGVLLTPLLGGGNGVPEATLKCRSFAASQTGAAPLTRSVSLIWPNNQNPWR